MITLCLLAVLCNDSVKAINPNVSTIFYYNSVLDFEQYKLHGAHRLYLTTYLTT